MSNFPNSTNPNYYSQTSPPLNNLSLPIMDPDKALSNSDHLTRSEVLSRRSRKLHQLARLYKNQYWALMEQVKNQYGKYYWEYELENNSIDNCDGGGEAEEGENKAVVTPLLFGNSCALQGCKMKAMQLTRFCHMHILKDDKQQLYKGCGYVVKSSPAGPILCSKPILRATVPSLCTTHMQKAEKDVARALRKAGLSGHSTSKLAPQFHVILAEYVNQIQAKRKAARQVKKEPFKVNEEDDISV
ncbi:uncharacterized protein LOC141720655 isoform X2 [Apium graveolens]|uniref:uncharacterized protein LOC141720655 isoform X2 n=1 Tax=Apium graveolens TaxID=4045 RepID=UPI003D7A4DFB